MVPYHHGRRFVLRRRHAGRGLVRPEMAHRRSCAEIRVRGRRNGPPQRVSSARSTPSSHGPAGARDAERLRRASVLGSETARYRRLRDETAANAEDAQSGGADRRHHGRRRKLRFAFQLEVSNLNEENGVRGEARWGISGRRQLEKAGRRSVAVSAPKEDCAERAFRGDSRHGPPGHGRAAPVLRMRADVPHRDAEGMLPSQRFGNIREQASQFLDIPSLSLHLAPDRRMVSGRNLRLQSFKFDFVGPVLSTRNILLKSSAIVAVSVPTRPQQDVAVQFQKIDRKL